MEIENKSQILQRRREIEKELLDMLKETKSDFGLDDIKEIIYNFPHKVIGGLSPAEKLLEYHQQHGQGNSKRKPRRSPPTRTLRGR